MDQPDETPLQATHEPTPAYASSNGSLPPHPADLEAQIAAAAVLLESLNLRIRNVQAVNLMIFGALVLLVAHQLREGIRDAIR